jgi:hypothetical protein
MVLLMLAFDYLDLRHVSVVAPQPQRRGLTFRFSVVWGRSVAEAVIVVFLERIMML